MPKETTHILFARSLLEQDQVPLQLKTALTDSKAYLVGAILPDAFYYSTLAKAPQFAALIHGQNPNAKNNPSRLIQNILEQAKTTSDPTDLSLGLGLATHLILDAALHPLVDQASGDYDDPDPIRRQSARYRHRLLETKLDQVLQTDHSLPRCPVASPTAKALNRLGEKLGWDGASARRALNQQRLANGLFQTRLGFLLGRILHRLGRIDRSILGLFPGQLIKDPDTIDTLWHSRSQDGLPLNQALQQALTQAKAEGGRFLLAAWSFVQGKTSSIEFQLNLSPGDQ